MIISKVVLKNFKKHSNLTVEFSSGSNLITGSNYAGKSTILQAILVGLYGNHAAPCNTKDLVKDGCSDFLIEVSLDTGFVIKRTLKNSEVLDSFGEVKVRTHSAVNKWCEELFNADRKTFTNVFSSQQGSPQALLNMEGAELQKFIEVSVGVGKLDEVKKSVSRKALTHEAKQEVYENMLLSEVLVQQHTVNLENYGKLVSSSKAVVADGKVLIKKAEAELEATVLSLDRWISLKRRWDDYLKEKATLEQLLGATPAPVNVPLTEELINEVEEQTKKYADFDASFRVQTKLKQNRALNLSKITNRKDIIEVLARNLKGNDIDLSPILTSLGKGKLSVEGFKKEILLLENSLEDSKCHTCGRKFSSTFDTSGKVKELIVKRADLTLAEKKVVEIQAEHCLLFKRKQDYEGLLKQKEGHTLEVKLLEELVSKQKQELRAFEDNLVSRYLSGFWLADLKKSQAALESLKRLDQEQKVYATQALTLKAKIVALHKPLSEVDLIEEERLSEKKDSLLKDLGFYRSTSEEASRVIEKYFYEIKRLAGLLESNVSVKEDLDSNLKLWKSYQVIAGAVSQTRGVVTERAFSEVFGITSHFVKNCTGGDISEVSLEEQGIRYKEGGVSRGASSASGAQKTLIGVGMKLGLAQVVHSPFSGMLLDEISADMDEEVSLACLASLSDYCDQAIIVSHTAMDIADNFIEL